MKDTLKNQLFNAKEELEEAHKLLRLKTERIQALEKAGGGGKPVAPVGDVDELINKVCAFHGFQRVPSGLPGGGHMIMGGLRGPAAPLVLSLIKVMRHALLTGVLPQVGEPEVVGKKTKTEPKPAVAFDSKKGYTFAAPIHPDRDRDMKSRRSSILPPKARIDMRGTRP